MKNKAIINRLAVLQKQVKTVFNTNDGIFGISEDRVHLSSELFKETFYCDSECIVTIDTEWDEQYNRLETMYNGTKFFALEEKQ